VNKETLGSIEDKEDKNTDKGETKREGVVGNVISSEPRTTRITWTRRLGAGSSS
jgi:hypothetical protein